MLAREFQLTPGPWEYLASVPGPRSTKLVLARDLQLTPGPQDLLASAGQGPQAFSQTPGPPS